MNALSLPDVSPQELASFKAHRREIIDATHQKVLQIFDFSTLLGENYEELVYNGIVNTAKIFETVMQVSFANLMDQQLDWAKDYFPNIGIPSEIVLKEIEIFAAELDKRLPAREYPGLAAWMDMMVQIQKKIVEH